MLTLNSVNIRRLGRAVVAGFLGVLGASALAQDAQAVFKKALPSVMTLTVNIKGGGTASGTGFLALREGVAVTAWHVVADAESVVARFSDGQEFEVTGLIDKDEKRDIALIRVKVADRPMLTLAPTDPEIGSKAFVLGAPEGLEFSITDGIISQVRSVNGIKLYQYSAPSNQGNSGGPVLSPDSEVLGVVSYGLRNSAGLNFAIAGVNVRGLDNTLPTQPWSTVPTSPGPARPINKNHVSFSDAMKNLWMMAVLMQVDTEELMRGKFHKLSPLFNEAQIRLKVSSDVLDSALSSNNSTDWETFHIGYFNQIIAMSILTAEQLNTCSKSRKSRELYDEVSKFVTSFRMTEVDSEQVSDLRTSSGTNVVRLLGPLLTTKILASQQQKGWMPEEIERVSRKRFEGGYKLLSRLAFDVDSTGYVFGFLVDPTNSARIFEVQGGTPPMSWGFKKGDIVLSVNGTKVSTVEMMKQVILSSRTKEGWVVVDRKGRPATLKVSFRRWVPQTKS
jgi:S1-C subfamily serine protease